MLSGAIYDKHVVLIKHHKPYESVHIKHFFFTEVYLIKLQVYDKIFTVSYKF